MLAAMQDMQPSKTSFQLVSIDLGDGNPPTTLLRMCQANRAISLVLRQVHAALCPVDVTLDQFQLTASKQSHAAIKTVEGPDCFWIFKYGATGRHSHKGQSHQPGNCCPGLQAAWCGTLQLFRTWRAWQGKANMLSCNLLSISSASIALLL